MHCCVVSKECQAIETAVRLKATSGTVVGRRGSELQHRPLRKKLYTPEGTITAATPSRTRP